MRLNTLNMHMPKKYFTVSPHSSTQIMRRYINKAAQIVASKPGHTRDAVQSILDNLYMAQEFAPMRYRYRVNQLYTKFCSILLEWDKV